MPTAVRVMQHVTGSCHRTHDSECGVQDAHITTATTPAKFMGAVNKLTRQMCETIHNSKRTRNETRTARNYRAKILKYLWNLTTTT